MSLKGRGQRPQACPVVVINIKESLIMVEGLMGPRRLFFFGRWCTGYYTDCSLMFGSGCYEAPSPHTLALLIQPAAGSLSLRFALWIPASTKGVFVCGLSLLAVVVYQACPMTPQNEGPHSPVYRMSALFLDLFERRPLRSKCVLIKVW